MINIKPVFLAVVVSGISLSGCSFDINDPAKPWFYPRSGSKLIVNEAITIPAGRASVYLQNGNIAGGNRNRFEPYCKIRVRNLKDTVQMIQPDTFTITASGRHTQLVTGLNGVHIPLGSPEPVSFGIRIGRSEAPSDVTETVQMNLSSKLQPQVTLMECGGVEDHPGNAEPPTLKEMQQALGSHMSFQIN